MKRVLIVEREDLVGGKKLTPTAEVELANFHTDFVKMTDYELIVFYCTLTNSCAIIKNRFGRCIKEMSLNSRDDKAKFSCCIMGMNK